MYDNMITYGGEITSQGTFETNSGAFYLFIAPKKEDAPAIGVFNVKISRNVDNTDYPFVVGVWNPVVINQIDVTSENLANYRIFWGETT